MKEQKVNKDLPNNRNVWRLFIRNCPTHANEENRRQNQYDGEKQQIVTIYTSYTKKFCNMYTSQEGPYLIHACPFFSTN